MPPQSAPTLEAAVEVETGALADEEIVDVIDDVLDLTDRRRMFVRFVFGLDLDPTLVDTVFEVDLAGDADQAD